uniref:Pentatricopeptide repeat-containing protein n=1 Tax=Chenopodium quinoa TaxID=63459 RepID=A0A803L936_CHEQI
MERSLLAFLRSSHHINQLKQIHALIITRYPFLSPNFAHKLLNLTQLKYARKVFDEMPNPDERLYNMFISAYSRIGSYKEAVGMFCLMRRNDNNITSYSVPPVLKSCSAFLMVGLGKQVHSLIISFGLESNCFVQTALMDLYARSGDLVSAKMVFDCILDRDPITYNCLMSGYSKSSDVLAARRRDDELFVESLFYHREHRIDNKFPTLNHERHGENKVIC